jgi:hypothetical protein
MLVKNKSVEEAKKKQKNKVDGKSDSCSQGGV